VLTPPDGLSEELLVSLLAAHWRLEVAAIGYSAVGFGSHHWEVTDATGMPWFVTVDELRKRRHWGAGCLTCGGSSGTGRG
jgi:spectinomycin phosphotransferase/16S rRNA (guanine(1405)-N(7))-methyltransferase